MNRLAAILSLFLIGLVSAGWVIKDTANPVEIYTGSNTTPSISAAGTGAVTVGPATIAVQHKVEGTLKIDTNGSATTGLVMSINNQSGTPGTMLEVFSEGTTSATRVVDFKNSNGSSKLFVRSDGAFGVATADVTFKDTNAGADNTNQTAAFARFDEDENRLHVGTGAAPSTTVALSGSFKNTGGNRIRGSAIFFNDAGGGAPTVTTTAGAETGNIVFYTKPSSGGVAIVGTIDGAGAWTIGPPGFSGIHTANGELSATTLSANTVAGTIIRSDSVSIATTNGNTFSLGFAPMAAGGIYEVYCADVNSGTASVCSAICRTDTGGGSDTCTNIISTGCSIGSLSDDIRITNSSGGSKTHRCAITRGR